MVLANRTGVKSSRKGDPLWLRGVFLGKSDNDLYITWHMDGIKTSRSAKRCPEHFDAKAISSVGIHSWEVKHTTLATRVVPKKSIPGPKPVMTQIMGSDTGEQDQAVQDKPSGPQSQSEAVVIQGGDSGEKPGPVIPRTTYLAGKAKQHQAAQKRKAEQDLEEAEHEAASDVLSSDPSSSSSPQEKELGMDVSDGGESEELLPDSAMLSELLTARGPPQLRKAQFEDVGTGSKIPKLDSPTKKYPPFNVGRVFEHNDEELPEAGTDDIFWEDTYSEIGDSDEEQDIFTSEDAGPPELSEEELRVLDREAMVTEIDRLKDMKAVDRVPLQELEREEERGENCEGNEERDVGTKWLTTKFVFDWRFRGNRWIRRARLVAREFKTQEHRTDTFSPATSASLVRLIPVLGLQQEYALYSVDVKDAFLQVPQRNRTACEFPKEYVELFGEEDPNCRNEGLLLLRVLPGQRDAALLWSDHFASTLQEQDFDRCVACPTLFRDKMKSILVVHVDDIQAAGKNRSLAPVLSMLGKTYELKIEGPFLTEQELAVGESLQTIRFLKRKFTYHNHELHIKSDPKYLIKLKEELKLKSTASKPTPCTHESQEADHTNSLDQEQAASFRKCVGILLYVGQDRPDLQFAVRGLASRMSEPTYGSWKHLIHLVQYMSKTEGYHLVYRKTPRGLSNLHESIRNGSYDFTGVESKEYHLLEVFSDSDWAGKKDTRRSTSSGNVFLDGQVIYSFSRSQKTVSLSSGEAEYYAAASAASDSILLKEAIQFLTGKRCVVHLHLDSSAARGIITRQGVGRVKHLQIRTLFLQDLHKQGTVSVHPVGTKDNTADIGTKPLSGKRIKLLLHWLGFQTENNEPVGKQELKDHRTQEQAKATVRLIKSKGTFAFAALMFSTIAGISEGFVFEGSGKVSGTDMSVMRACEQDVMCISDTSEFALGTVMSCCRNSLHAGNMCACEVGTVCAERVGAGNSPHSECSSQAVEVEQEHCREPSRKARKPVAMSGTGEETSFNQLVQELREILETTRQERSESMESVSISLQESSMNMSRLAEESQATQKLLSDYKKETEEIKNIVKEIKQNEAEAKDEVKEIVKDLKERIESLEDFVKWYAQEEEEEEEDNEENDAEKERKDRELEAELRREGHLQETTSWTTSSTSSKGKQEGKDEATSWTTPTTSSKEGKEEATSWTTSSTSSKGKQEGKDEATSWTTPTTSSKEGKNKEEEAESITEKIRRINEEIQRKAEESKDKESDFEYPRDFSSEWKFYTENGSIYRQHYVTQEKIWCDYDYAYKHEKGKGKNKKKKGHAGEEEGKTSSGSGGQQPLSKEQEEELKAKLKKTLEAAAEENDRRLEKERQAKEEEAREAAAKQAKEAQEAKEAQAAKEAKEAKAAAIKAKEEEERHRKNAAAQAAAAEKEAEARKELEEAVLLLMQEREKDKERIERLEKALSQRGSDAGSTTEEESRSPAKEKEEKEDPEVKEKGPYSPRSYVKGSGKDKTRNSYAVFQYKEKFYQWKWNNDSQYWYFFDSEGKSPGEGKWVKQHKDKNGRKVCDEQLKKFEKFVEEKRKEKDKSQEKGEEGKGSSSSSNKDVDDGYYEITSFS